MLGDYLYFNNEQFPNPITPKKQSKTLENVSQSEAGTDLVCVIRPSKKTWNFKFDLTPAKKEILEALCEEESTSMTYMGSSYTVRVRDFSEELAEGSEWISSVNGLFSCSVKVTEF